ITTSFLVAVVFFGGWDLPFGLTDGDGWFATFLKLASILVKGRFSIFFYVWVRWTLPRFRFDQLMGIAWKLLIPLSVVNLVAAMCIREYDAPKWSLTLSSLGLFVAATAAAARRPAVPAVHKTGKIHGLPAGMSLN